MIQSSTTTATTSTTTKEVNHLNCMLYISPRASRLRQACVRLSTSLNRDAESSDYTQSGTTASASASAAVSTLDGPRSGTLSGWWPSVIFFSFDWNSCCRVTGLRMRPPSFPSNLFTGGFSCSSE
ncbi:hypothetical protein ElyMa_004202500 [Elysia marginata]|uniref:Uncharacterized protein n=1 Tax=Elysia marginata TaxID=1093978 RepID=A0AAV4GNS8_9GAST|nr:hypothetical protein ElyMa_004202500 [Elysia marginata]